MHSRNLSGEAFQRFPQSRVGAETVLGSVRACFALSTCLRLLLHPRGCSVLPRNPSSWLHSAAKHMLRDAAVYGASCRAVPGLGRAAWVGVGARGVGTHLSARTVICSKLMGGCAEGPKPLPRPRDLVACEVRPQSSGQPGLSNLGSPGCRCGLAPPEPIWGARGQCSKHPSSASLVAPSRESHGAVSLEEAT